LRFVIFFLLSFFSAQISAQPTFNTTYVSMISPQNIYQKVIYVENNIEAADLSLKTCEIEKENFFESLFYENEDDEKTFMGIEFDYIKLGMSFLSLSMNFVVPME
jgi:hypothetical protein